MQNKVVIIGCEHHNTLSMIRDLGQRGLCIILILYGSSHEYITSSCYLNRVIECDSPKDILRVLLKIVDGEPVKPVIITCTDDSTSIIDKAYVQLLGKCFFFNAGASGRITYYMDKYVQLSLAKKSGFKTPSSIECFPYEIGDKTISYPCILKPKESIHGGKQIFVCENADEVCNSAKQFSAEHKILIQDYLKKDYEVVILGVSVGGKHQISGIVRKHRDYKGGTTFCTSYPSSYLPEEVINSCVEMMSEIQYEGLWGIECIVEKGKFYFIELNLRNDATSYVITKAGFDSPYYFFQRVLGNEDYLSNEIASINAMVEFEDFNFVLKFHVNIFKWLSEKRKCGCLYYYSQVDKKPYIRKRHSYIKLLLKRLLPN